jgi:hypothetical protein
MVRPASRDRHRDDPQRGERRGSRHRADGAVPRRRLRLAYGLYATGHRGGGLPGATERHLAMP